jgi:hypothetical protein
VLWPRIADRCTILGVTASLCALLAACGNVCGNEVEREATSPDGRTVAVAYVRNCGAMVDYSTLVQLRPASQHFEENNPAGTVLDIKGWAKLDLSWTSNSSLLVSCAECREQEILSAVGRWKSVLVSYVLSGRPLKPQAVSRPGGS